MRSTPKTEFKKWLKKRGPQEPMADDPRLPPLSEPHLMITPYQVKSMMSNKAIAFVPMWPVDFIRLTTSSEEALSQFTSPDPDHKGKKATVEDYNEAARAGYINLAPWLTVEMKSGRVVGHEGRHRMAALYRSNPEAYGWVAFEVTNPEGYRVYYVEKPYDPETGRSPRHYLTVDVIPSVLKGQFRPVEVRLMPEQLSDAVNLWEDQSDF